MQYAVLIGKHIINENFFVIVLIYIHINIFIRMFLEGNSRFNRLFESLYLFKENCKFLQLIIYIEYNCKVNCSSFFFCFIFHFLIGLLFQILVYMKSPIYQYMYMGIYFFL